MLKGLSNIVLAMFALASRADAGNGNLYNFSLPLFDINGLKICDIFGKNADVSNENSFKISDIKIQTFEQLQNQDIPSFLILSDQADISSSENVAYGSGFIAISNANFSATGTDWKFSGNQKHFVINSNVQVFFEKTNLNHD